MSFHDLAMTRAHAVRTPDATLHCSERASDGPTMVMLHSLSGNTRIFDGLLHVSFAPGWRLLMPDMRGRGRSEAPLSGYTLDDACKDLIAVLDHFGIERAAFCGHSYGGLTALYFAARHPERVSHLMMLDAAARMHPAAPALAACAAARIDQVFPSRQLYLSMAPSTPFVDTWYEPMRAFFDEDVKDIGWGWCTTRARSHAVVAATQSILARTTEGWMDDARQVRVPSMIVQANRPFLMGLPMLDDGHATQTVAAMERGSRAYADGNHLTMLFGPGALQVKLAAQRLLEGVVH